MPMLIAGDGDDMSAFFSFLVSAVPRLADTGSRPTQLFGFWQKIGVVNLLCHGFKEPSPNRSTTPKYKMSCLSFSRVYHPSRDTSPGIFLVNLPAGHSPASHQAAKPELSRQITKQAFTSRSEVVDWTNHRAQT